MQFSLLQDMGKDPKNQVTLIFFNWLTRLLKMHSWGCGFLTILREHVRLSLMRQTEWTNLFCEAARNQSSKVNARSLLLIFFGVIWKSSDVNPPQNATGLPNPGFQQAIPISSDTKIGNPVIMYENYTFDEIRGSRIQVILSECPAELRIELRNTTEVSAEQGSHWLHLGHSWDVA